MPLAKERGKVFYGWWVVFACSIIHVYTAGTFFSGFTALFNPIVKEFGWSYVIVSLAATFRGVETGVLAPIAGILVDRFGSRKLLLGGVVIMGLGFLFLGSIHTLWSFYSAFAIIAFGFSLASLVVTMTAVAQWFRQRRTLAMGFLATGFAAGGLLVPAVVWIIDQFGWRTATINFGAGMWLLGIPLALVVKSPQDGENSAESGKVSLKVTQKPDELTVKEVLKMKGFWLLSMSILFSWLAGGAITVHQIPYMVSIGISRQTAALMVLVFALSNVTGRLLFGWFGDIFDKRRIFAVAASIKAMGVLAFALATSMGQIIPSMIALGIGQGALVPLRPALQGEFFGTKAFGTVQGLLMTSATVGTVVSPPFAGWMFDSVGSYRPAFLILAVVTLMAVPTILAIPRKASAGFGTPWSAQR